MAKFIRKLQRIGSSTLVSLPKEWVEANGLSKNVEVEVETVRDAVVITAGRKGRPSREITIPYPLPPGENIAADLTGAYLLGYDGITVRGAHSIHADDRERIRNSTRRLAGMEIVEENAATVEMRFQLDPGTLDPRRILRRMSSMVLGMYNDTISGLAGGDRSDLGAMPSRDDEVDRQYFLLVRLIRSTMVDRRPAGGFDLEDTDILDYRMAANLLEGAGDAVVEIAAAVATTSLPQEYLGRIYDAVKRLELIEPKVIDAFVNNDRGLAIEAITMHRSFEEAIQSIKSPVGRRQIPIDYLDLVYMFERAERCWADIADLVKPVYPG
ncbi:phosphate uptake regulator [Cenarchaeum symbiosum A]|uniref:Phosphate uptake regulator n=1 Tax=Cenarchaeum symbiosum (strain A) TaxID=414004 RepID=A0RXQ8_CENSY|nr:phosphate uptake regulator [Cenarchaeum symbiosum A]